MEFTRKRLKNYLGRDTVWAVDGKHRLRVVGRTTYKCPINETFAEFLVTHLKWTLGRDWVKSEVSKSPDSRHPIMSWIYDLWEMSKNLVPENHDRRPVPAESPGSVRDLLALAYDVYQLAHTDNTPSNAVKRLRSRKSYQGAMYEIAIAGVFARLGCSLVYLDDGRNDPHPEFVARIPRLAVQVSVEAKSRQRPGVHGRPGTADATSAARGDLADLVTRALKQLPDGMSGIVFVDMNAPKTPDLPFDAKPWRSEVERAVLPFTSTSASAPSRVECVFVTNLCSQYDAIAPGLGGEVVCVLPRNARNHIPPTFLHAVTIALTQHGELPPDVY